MIDMKLLSATLAAAGLALSGCGGGGGGGGGIGGTGSAAQGTLRVSMTDAPACGYESGGKAPAVSVLAHGREQDQSQSSRIRGAGS